jgi:methylenetetrahydrofolate reductase (NADPH)
MRFIRDLCSSRQHAGQPLLSFEFFTPKTDEGERSLFEKALPVLARVRPDFCSVTYGAGGGTRHRTLRMVDRIQRQFDLPAMAHLTCVNSTRDDLADMLGQAQALGIRNILALRGDPPAGQNAFTPPPGGFHHAFELVRFAREHGDFCVGVAAFPEGHLECREGREVDWDRLKRKIDCGADFVITQLFFDNAHYYRFRDHLTRRLGVTVPLIPGIIPIMSAGQIKRFTALCGASLPADLMARLEALGDDDLAVTEYGIDFAAQQCADLLKQGVPGLHFYTLNKSYATLRILCDLDWDLLPAKPQ